MAPVQQKIRPFIQSDLKIPMFLMSFLQKSIPTAWSVFMAWRLLVTHTDKIQLVKIILAMRLTWALCRHPQAGFACLSCKVTPAIANTDPSSWPLASQSSTWGATCNAWTLIDEQFLPFLLIILQGVLCLHWSTTALLTPALSEIRAFWSFNA